MAEREAPTALCAVTSGSACDKEIGMSGRGGIWAWCPLRFMAATVPATQ